MQLINNILDIVLNLQELHHHPLHSRCAVYQGGVLDTHIFFEEGGKTVTVYSDPYYAILENFLW